VTDAPSPLRDIRTISLFSLSAAALLIVAAGAWGSTAPIASAVIAPGQVVVESNVRKVQHPTGGVVAEIRVDNGDHVKAGDVLVRLDDTVTRANLAVIDSQLNQLLVREVRLSAERDALPDFSLPEELTVRAEQAPIRKILSGEHTIFTSRQTAKQGQTSQLRERISQTQEEVKGLEAQVASKRQQTGFIQTELEGVRSLYKDNLVPLSRVTALEREAARLLGEEGQHIADIARAKGRVAETEMQILQLDQDLQKEIAAELRDTESKIAELRERYTAALDQLNRVDIRAPQDGIVHQKTVYTRGGVVSPGEQLMLIVPEAEGLVVDVRIEPQLIDRLKIGQPVTMKFSAFNSATMPDVFGTLARISADVSRDEQSGAMFYTARIAVLGEELGKFQGKALVPGMPVETFIDTGARTAFAYLTKPINDQLARAFRYE
jgi:HlyD family secretion protein